MRNLILVPIAGLVLLSACNTEKKPSDANFAAAINQYLVNHGQACTAIGRQFPVDVPKSGQNDPTGIGAKLTALELADLAHATNTTAVVHGMLDPLRGPASPQAIRRYELTDEGEKYFQLIPGKFGQTGGFCYGQKNVDSITKWTEPEMAGSPSRAEVTYAYKIVNLAAWAQRADVQQAFPDIRATINGASKANQMIGVQLTNKGWEVPEP